jgi:hypothetical protein
MRDLCGDSRGYLLDTPNTIETLIAIFCENVETDQGSGGLRRSAMAADPATPAKLCPTSAAHNVISPRILTASYP